MEKYFIYRKTYILSTNMQSFNRSLCLKENIRIIHLLGIKLSTIGSFSIIVCFIS